MTVGLLLVTHNQIGDAILATAISTLGLCPLKAHCIAVPPEGDPDAHVVQGEDLLADLDDGDGVLVLTDAYGSTPSNIACRIGGSHRVAVVSGLNLPMLLRILNYPKLSLDELKDKAVSGGQDGVLLVCSEPAAQGSHDC